MVPQARAGAAQGQGSGSPLGRQLLLRRGESPHGRRHLHSGLTRYIRQRITYLSGDMTRTYYPEVVGGILRGRHRLRHANFRGVSRLQSPLAGFLRERVQSLQIAGKEDTELPAAEPFLRRCRLREGIRNGSDLTLRITLPSGHHTWPPFPRRSGLPSTSQSVRSELWAQD